MIGRNRVALPEHQHDSSTYIPQFVPAFNLATLKARPREDKQLLLWYCMRAIDTTGRGVLDQGLAIRILKTAPAGLATTNTSWGPSNDVLRSVSILSVPKGVNKGGNINLFT